MISTINRILEKYGLFDRSDYGIGMEEIEWLESISEEFNIPYNQLEEDFMNEFSMLKDDIDVDTFINEVIGAFIKGTASGIYHGAKIGIHALKGTRTIAKSAVKGAVKGAKAGASAAKAAGHGTKGTVKGAAKGAAKGAEQHAQYSAKVVGKNIANLNAKAGDSITRHAARAADKAGTEVYRKAGTRVADTAGDASKVLKRKTDRIAMGADAASDAAKDAPKNFGRRAYDKAGKRAEDIPHTNRATDKSGATDFKRADDTIKDAHAIPKNLRRKADKAGKRAWDSAHVGQKIGKTIGTGSMVVAGVSVSKSTASAYKTVIKAGQKARANCNGNIDCLKKVGQSIDNRKIAVLQKAKSEIKSSDAKDKLDQQIQKLKNKK